MTNALSRSSIRYGAAALAATAALMAGGCGSGTQAANGSSKEPISLPDRLDGFENTLTVIQRHAPYAAAIATNRRSYRDAERQTVAAYSRAYGGAAAATRTYVDATMQDQGPVSVIAVRAPSPGLTAGPVTNPADLGLAVNERAVHVFGDVACVVVDNVPEVSGRRVDPSNFIYEQCQRTGPRLTVSVFSDLHGDAGRRKAVALTDSAYRATAGG